MRQPPAIVAERLSKRYGVLEAVHEISFQIEQGEVVAILGPNGAGKTTTMRMLTGLLPPTSGRVCIGSFDIAKDRIASAEVVGYLPEDCPLYLDMTAHQSLWFLGRVRGLSRAVLNSRIEEVAARFDIGAVLGKPIGTLSKGLRQRVGLAQALLHRPPIVIMDEPTAGLDPLQVKRFRKLILDLRGRATVIISSHILHEAASLVDRVLVINRGRLVFDDTIEMLSAGGTLEDQFCRLVAASESDR